VLGGLGRGGESIGQRSLKLRGHFSPERPSYFHYRLGAGQTAAPLGRGAGTGGSLFLVLRGGEAAPPRSLRLRFLRSHGHARRPLRRPLPHQRRVAATAAPAHVRPTMARGPRPRGWAVGRRPPGWVWVQAPLKLPGLLGSILRLKTIANTSDPCTSLS
jgi:hypothetical protein